MENRNPYQSPTADVSAHSAHDGYDESSPFSPSGRFGRLSYLAWNMAMAIAVMIIFVGMFGVSAAMKSTAVGLIFMAVIFIAILLMVIPLAIFTIRRLHDFDASGWLALLLFVPIANFVLSLLLYFKPGTPRANRYAPPRITRGWEKALGYFAIFFPVIGIVAAIAIPAYNASRAIH